MCAYPSPWPQTMWTPGAMRKQQHRHNVSGVRLVAARQALCRPETDWLFEVGTKSSIALQGCAICGDRQYLKSAPILGSCTGTVTRSLHRRLCPPTRRSRSPRKQNWPRAIPAEWLSTSKDDVRACDQPACHEARHDDARRRLARRTMQSS